MSDCTTFLRVAADRIGAPGLPGRVPFRATNAANWSSIIRIGTKMAVIRRRIARRAASSHTQRAGRVPYGESRIKETDVSNADFLSAKGLRQRKLDRACAHPEDFPVNLPKHAQTGDQLVWNGKACEK